MSNAGGLIVRLLPERLKVLEEQLNENKNFDEPVLDFDHSRNMPLICFIIDDASERITHLSIGKKGVFGGTGLRVLKLTKIAALENVVLANQVVAAAPNRVSRKLEEKLIYGGILPLKSFQAMIEIMSKLAPEMEKILQRYGEERNQRIASLSDKTKNALAQQKEAVVTALAIAEMDRGELNGWDVNEDSDKTSFLDGLEQIRLREDTMIINDLNNLPGYESIKNTPHPSVTFENEKSKLTVVLANRLPLEKQLGTDLIYYNETFQCFIMVQYKAMEKEGDETIYRFPNSQLTEEIQRMNGVSDQLKKCQPNTETDGYRLSENPFFLKICPRIVFDPDNIGLVTGMYLPLEYWDLLSEHPTMTGPRDGKRVSYRNVRRYFNNTEFIALAGGAWVGTNIDQSSKLEVAIRSTLESGRAVVFAIKSEKDYRHRVDDQQFLPALEPD